MRILHRTAIRRLTCFAMSAASTCMSVMNGCSPGPGLYAIYEFLRDAKKNEPTWLAEKIKAGDPAAEIAEAGLKGQAEIAKQALDLFASIYGAEAGNLGAQGHGHQWRLRRRRHRSEALAQTERRDVHESLYQQRSLQTI